jgi:hypothetical protein
VFALMLLMTASAEPDVGLAKKMLPIYTREVEDYSLAVESAPKKPLQLKKEAVLEWSNQVRDGEKVHGTTFIWLRDGRPAAICSVYSEPEMRLRGWKLYHEFHALDREKLVVTRPKGALNEWKPEAGLVRKEIRDAPAPAETPAARLLQMKRLAQEFSAYSVDMANKRLDLRLLPTPLHRYPIAKTGVVDGALFTHVMGTDPEVLLIIELVEAEGKMHWEYACGRYSDKSLHVERKGKEMWSLARSDANSWLHDQQHLFRIYPDKVVSMEGKPIARVRAVDKMWWGEYFPAEEK